MPTNSVLAKLAVQISANTAEFNKAIQQTQNSFSNFTKDVTKIAGTIGVAFGVQQVAAFAFEVSKLAGEADGVQAAFDKLPNSIALMGQLKDATAGTVSELDLMKRAVQAANFGIELESLPKLLEFAAIRAQQTGQSVDYLVDSIVTGIGRKSPLILDNLGISAVRLKEQFGGAALEAQSIGDVAKAVGRIAGEELTKMGNFAENASTKVQRLSASWENFKVAVGRAANSTGVLDKTLNIFTNTLNAIGGDELTQGINQLKSNLGTGSEILERFAAAGGKIDLSWQELLQRGFVANESAAKKYEKILGDIATQARNLALANKAVAESNDTVAQGTPWKKEVVIPQIDTIESLREKIKQLNKDFDTTDATDKKKLANIGAQIIATNEQIKTLEKLRKAQEEAAQVNLNSLEGLQAALKKVNDEYAKADQADVSRLRQLASQAAGYQQLIDRLEQLKSSFKDTDFVIKPPDTSALLNPIKEITETTLGGLQINSLSTSFDEMVKRFEAGLKKLATTTKTVLPEVKGEFISLTGPISSALSGVGEAIGGAIAGTQKFGDSIIKVVAGFARQLGEILIATGTAMLAAKKLISNPYTAIIAGVALVALATAANAAISSSHKSSFGGGTSAQSASQAATPFNPDQVAQTIQFDAKFRIEGSDLVAVANNTNHRNERGG